MIIAIVFVKKQISQIQGNLSDNILGNNKEPIKIIEKRNNWNKKY